MTQIKRMEMEARSFAPERARALLQKVKEYKADLATLRADAKKVLTIEMFHDRHLPGLALSI